MLVASPWHTPASRLAARSPSPKMHASILRPKPRMKPLLRSNQREVAVGDAVVLTTFSLYKQISGIVMSPGFEGEWEGALTMQAASACRWGGCM